MSKPRIVLAFSGRARPAQIAQLADHGRADVVTVTLDVGQGAELADVRQQALNQGAIRAHVMDVRDELARDYIVPVLQAGAVSPQRRPMSIELVRPLLAKHLIRVADMEGARTVVFRSDTEYRPAALERSLRSLDRAMAQTILTTTAQPVPAASGATTPEVRQSLWGRVMFGDAFTDPWTAPPAVYTLTKALARCPDAPAYLEVGFERGIPTKVNGVPMDFPELTGSVGAIAGSHGVGRFDVLDQLHGDVAVRAVGEAPAAVVLHMAHDDLQTFVVPADLAGLARRLGRAYVGLLCEGRWFGPTRPAIDAFVASVQSRVTGTVRLRLFKGTCEVVGRQSALGPSADSPAPRYSSTRVPS